MMTTSDRGSDRYFSDDEDAKQLRPFPRKWMDASRFKVGDKIEFLRDTRIHIPCEECKARDQFHYNGANLDKCESRSMKGLIGVVTGIRNGYGEFPSRYVSEIECWVGQKDGWLGVQFEISPYRKPDGTYGGIGCDLSGEGRYWKRAK